MSAAEVPKRAPGWPAHAIQKSHSPRANALRALRWAEKHVARVEREKVAAQARLARAQARVDYYDALAAADATTSTDGGSA